MENNIFIDRKKEREFLNKLYERGNPQLIVIYGRRRIGKTFLIKKFLDSKKGIYYLATKESEEVQARDISKALSDFFKDKTLAISPFTKYSQVLEYIASRSDERLIFVIDEFGYMMESSPYVSSVLQKYWDEYLSRSKVFIILNGSIITLMESLLSVKNPIYGRRTGQWHLGPLKFEDFSTFLDGRSFADKIKCWSTTGTILFYAKEFLKYKRFDDFIMDTFFNKGHIFYEEGRIIVSGELGEVDSYFSILSEISKGASRSIEIASRAGIKNTSISKYLKKLQEIGFISKELPITERRNSKKSLYCIEDNFLNFWFSFVYKNRGLVENDNSNELKKILDVGLNLFMGRAFEKLIRENITYLSPFTIEHCGRWWGKNQGKPKGMNTEEIDVVAINEKSKDILFGECKWTRNPVGIDIYKDLKRKSGLVHWHDKERKEHFALFSMSGFTAGMKELATNENVLLFDLDAIDKALSDSARKS